VVDRDALAVRERFVKATEASGPVSVCMCYRSVGSIVCVHFAGTRRGVFWPRMLDVSVVCFNGGV
jgi:hypothetical protein